MANYSLGEAVLGTGVDLSGLKKGLQRGETESKSLFSKMGGVLQTALGAAIGIGITKLPGLLMDIGRGIGGMVGDAAAVEQVSKNFDALTQSIGGTSDALLADLREATRGMVTDADLMASSNKLISMGLAGSTEEASKLTEMATQLGLAMGVDATTAMEDFALMLANQSIPRLDTFGISSSKVRERILELSGASGMTQEGIDQDVEKATARLSKLQDDLYLAQLKEAEFTDKTSLSTKERSRIHIEGLQNEIAEESKRIDSLKNMETGVAGLSREEAFMQAVMEEGAKTMAKVGEQGDSTKAAMERIKTTFENIKLAIGQAFLPVLDALISAFAPLIEEVSPLVTEWFGKLAEWLKEKLPLAIEWLKVAWEDAWPKVKETLLQAWNVIWPVLQTAWEWLKEHLPKALATLKDLWETAWPVIKETLAKAWEILKGIFEKLSGWFKGDGSESIGGFVSFAREQIAFIVEWFQKNWPLIQETVKKVLDAIKQFWDDHGEKIMAAVTSVWNIIKTVIDTVLKTIFDIIKFVMQIITGDWEGAWETIKGILERLAKAILSILENLLWAFANIFRMILDVVLDLTEDLRAGIVKTWTDIKSWLSDTWEDIKKAALTVFVAILTGIKDKLDSTVLAIRNAWSMAKSWVEQALDTIREKVRDAWDAVKDWVSDKVNDIVQKVKDMWEDMKDAGRRLVDGIKEGIRNAWDGFLRWLRGILDSAVDAVKKFFGIKSPSSLFAEIGQQMMAGLGMGIGQGVEIPVRAMLGAGGALTGALGAGGLSGGGQYVNIYGGLALHGVQDRGSLLEQLGRVSI